MNFYGLKNYEINIFPIGIFYKIFTLKSVIFSVSTPFLILKKYVIIGKEKMQRGILCRKLILNTLHTATLP